MVLIRWKNLVLILVTQFVAWFCVVRPGNPEVVGIQHFLLLAFSTVCIAAAGYIINDYFDVRIDAVNRPDKMVLGKTIGRRSAIIVHTVLNVAGVLAAAVVALSAGHLSWVLVQVVCTFLLWLYSSRFKQSYMVGNVVVSLLTALTILILILYEPSLHRLARLPVLSGQINRSAMPFWVLICYAWFAFVLNWMREIVKDIEDFAGDAKEGCRTMPIVKGISFSLRFIYGLAFFAFLPLLVSVYVLYLRHHPWFSAYLSGFLILPLVAWCIFLGRNYTSRHFANASRALKIIMIPGILSLLVYYLHL